MIKKIGVSLYTNDELKSIIENHDVDFVQIPFNVLDNWSQKGELILQAKEKHIDIHVRSIFLQGLFFMDELRIPSFLNPLKPFIIIIKQIAKEEKVTIQELLITYVLSNPNIDKVLFGVDNLNQLKSNLDIFNKSIDSQRIRTKIDSVKVNNNFLLDIRNWK